MALSVPTKGIKCFVILNKFSSSFANRHKQYPSPTVPDVWELGWSLIFIHHRQSARYCWWLVMKKLFKIRKHLILPWHRQWPSPTVGNLRWSGVKHVKTATRRQLDDNATETISFRNQSWTCYIQMPKKFFPYIFEKNGLLGLLQWTSLLRSPSHTVHTLRLKVFQEKWF